MIAGNRTRVATAGITSSAGISNGLKLGRAAQSGAQIEDGVLDAIPNAKDANARIFGTSWTLLGTHLPREVPGAAALQAIRERSDLFLPDLKRNHSFPGGVLLIHASNVAEPRPCAQGAAETVKLLGQTYCVHFDAAVRKVPGVAVNGVLTRGALSERPVSDTLDASAD